QYDTERPWFEHTDEGLTAHGQQCPYVRPERREVQLIKRLQQFVPDTLPVVRKANWHCRQCHHDYHGEQYCTRCQTGSFSEKVVAE
ncbi:TPA: putative zinc ribbon protein, partial [Escherichia coli]